MATRRAVDSGVSPAQPMSTQARYRSTPASWWRWSRARPAYDELSERRIASRYPGASPATRANLGEEPAEGAERARSACVDRQCRRLVRHEERQSIRNIVCILHAAKALGRPVKWTDERSAQLLSDSHGRDHEQTARARARQPRAISSPCGSPATAISALLSRAWRRARSTLNIGKNIGQRLSHAADRGVDIKMRARPTPRSMPPIAAPAAPRPTTSWSG